MEFTSQDIQYLINVVVTRPLAEALPMYLKLTGQRLIPDERKRGVDGSVAQLVKPNAE